MISLGVDIGFSEIKFVQLERKGDTTHVLKVGQIPILSDLNKFDPERISKSQWSAAIQDGCKSLGINPKKIKNVVTSLSGSKVNVREIATLEMEENELATSLEFEAKKHIPLDGTEAIIDYHILGNDPKEIDKVNVLLVATTRNTINSHAEIVKDAGFKPGIFNSDPVALVNSYLSNKDYPDEGVDVILNIGNQHTSIIVWGKDMPFFTRELQIAGHEFTKAIAKAQNVDYASAEAIKLEKGIEALTSSDTSEDDGVLSIKVAEKTVFTSLADEIRKTLRYYIKTNSQAFFNKFYLSGGSATVLGLQSFLADLLKVEMELFNPFENVSSDREVTNPAQYAVAMGLAITGNEKE